MSKPVKYQKRVEIINDNGGDLLVAFWIGGLVALFSAAIIGLNQLLGTYKTLALAGISAGTVTVMGGYLLRRRVWY